MDTYSIAERSLKPATPLSGMISGMKENPLQRVEKGLSISDSARRDLQATLQLLVERAQYITGASGAAIALRDGDRVLCRASSGSAAPELGAYLDLSAGLSGESVRTRAALRCDDAANDGRVDRESCRRLGIASFAVMPILRDGEAIGVFEVFSGKPHAFQERDLTALDRLREMVNTALDQAGPEHPKRAAFAVHGSKVRALAAAADLGPAIETNTSGGMEEHRPIQKGGIVMDWRVNVLGSQDDSKAMDRIRTCQSCGFPVSEGRALCVDCEAKGVAGDSGFVAAVQLNSSASGIKSWIITNRYVIGMILISAATIAFALLR